MESLVSDIPSGDGKMTNLFLQCEGALLTHVKGPQSQLAVVLRGMKIDFFKWQ
jgi:hypothetical protein